MDFVPKFDKRYFFVCYQKNYANSAYGNAIYEELLKKTGTFEQLFFEKKKKKKCAIYLAKCCSALRKMLLHHGKWNSTTFWSIQMKANNVHKRLSSKLFKALKFEWKLYLIICFWIKPFKFVNRLNFKWASFTCGKWKMFGFVSFGDRLTCFRLSCFMCLECIHRSGVRARLGNHYKMFRHFSEHGANISIKWRFLEKDRWYNKMTPSNHDIRQEALLPFSPTSWIKNDDFKWFFFFHFLINVNLLFLGWIQMPSESESFVSFFDSLQSIKKIEHFFFCFTKN